MLSDAKISSLYFEALGSQHLREQDRTTVSRFALAVEAEVRAQDTALIQQLVEALEAIDDAMPFPVERQVLKVARARLEGKPCA